MNPIDIFLKDANVMTTPTVLELGCYRSIPERSTLSKEWIPGFAEWIGTDMFAGEDVDLVADVHRLYEVIGRKFDIIISRADFEHFKYPQLAAFQISKCLNMGGLVFVQTCHTFPLHSYPFDYFRFSREALSACFGTRNGITEIGTNYDFECDIISKDVGNHKAWLNTCYYGIKTHETPKYYIYDL